MTTTTTQNCRYDGCIYWAIDPSRGHFFCGQHTGLPERYCQRAALMRDCPMGHDWDSDPLGRPVHNSEAGHRDALAWAEAQERAAIERERQEDEYGLPEEEEPCRYDEATETYWCYTHGFIHRPQPQAGTPVEGTTGWQYSGVLTPEEQYERGLITEEERDALRTPPEDDEPSLPEDEEMAYALALSEQDAMTLASFLRMLDRRHSVSLPRDIAEAVARVYERENEKHLGKDAR